MCTGTCGLDCKDWTSLSASSIACALSCALAKVNGFSASSLCWMCVLCNPDTNLSHNMSLIDSPNSQNLVSLRSLAT